MARAKSIYVCQQCGYESPKWMGRCPDCGEWNTLVEEVRQDVSHVAQPKQTRARKDTMCALSEVRSADTVRIDTGIDELNRVLGGGLVPGELLLLAGDPGVGKSTLTMQLCGCCSRDQQVVYISGEESAAQIRSRADRLGVQGKNILLVTENNVQTLDETVTRLKPALIILDSVQTAFDPQISSAPGSVSQLRAVATRAMVWAKQYGIPTVLIGHVTKDGSVAGPRVLEHMVDAVLFFEGDVRHQYRVLRALKNRFGSTHEIGLFDMTATGLTTVSNPSAAFLDERPLGVSGSTVTAMLEGSRPILVELQALVTRSPFGNPRRTTNGADYNRIAMLIAVIEKRLGLPFSDQDVYFNVVGGLSLDEPACDMAMVMAMVSSYMDKAVPNDMIFIGELGLTGEIRQVAQLERRLKEASSLGFTRAVVPKSGKKPLQVSDMQVFESDQLAEAIAFVWGKNNAEQ